MFKADGTKREFPILVDRFVIGRKSSCDLRIPLSSVSRQHCQIEREGKQIKLHDLGSSNGTYHNDTRVQEALLAAGDSFTVGPVIFTVVIDHKPIDIKPVRTILHGPTSDLEPKGHSVVMARDDDTLGTPPPKPPAPTIDLAEADAVQFDIDDLLSDDRT